MKEEQIRQFNGQIIGIIETDSSGNKTARDFPSRVITSKTKTKRSNFRLEE